LSLACVVVGAGAVVVVLLVLLPVVPLVVVVVDPPDDGAVVVVLPPPEDAAVVVVVGGGAAGATKGTVSLRMVVRLVVGVADRLVQLRAAFQLVTAAVAGVPVSGWGTPSRTVAGRHTAPVMCRPWAVTMRVPLSVSGAASS
jgi:hypothetical protein